METKTTEELANGCFETNFKKLKKDQRKWVAVDDVIDYIQRFSFVSGSELEFRKYIKEELVKILRPPDVEPSKETKNKKNDN